MALKIEKNEQGLYKLISTLTKETLHENEFIDESEVKKILISNELWNFLIKIIKIDIDFPTGYFVNNEVVKGNFKSDEFLNYAEKSGDYDSTVFNKFNEIRDSLKLDFNIEAISFEEIEN